MKAEFGGSTAAAAFAAGNCSSEGNALNISLASCANSAGVGMPAGKPALASKPVARLAGSEIRFEPGVGSLVLMVLSHIYVFEQAKRVVREHSRGAVE